MPAPSDRVEPAAGQESVWDYPRPPRPEAASDAVRVELGGVVIADSTRVLRVLETSHPPVIYVPPDDVRTALLVRNVRQTFCEFKGHAAYYDLHVDGQTIENAAWAYPAPTPAFAAIKDYLAFYPSKVDCFVAGERVTAQPGDFYGGWITSRVVGPFKGGRGTTGW